ncbi:hypothetical protein PR048_022172 [Dryococelus australis]|uniref:Uncharacterized protein n=1 Tax=Dryococelus australis TaxID=614101 RepID=A0ABQ9H0E7_9NEOP|nr:hypothetical protein PR048_022172 [Dryococelus australis]
MVYLKDPCLTKFEVEAKRPKREGTVCLEEVRLEELLQQQSQGEEWVHAMEQVPALLVPGLASAAHKDGECLRMIIIPNK